MSTPAKGVAEGQARNACYLGRKPRRLHDGMSESDASLMVYISVIASWLYPLQARRHVEHELGKHWA